MTKKNLNNRPTRSAARHISYASMFEDLDPTPTAKKSRKRILPALSGPSNATILACQTQTVHPKISHPVVQQSQKVETTTAPSTPSESSDAETIVYNQQDHHGNSDEENVPLSILRNRWSDTVHHGINEPATQPTTKHVFVSKTVGLIKRKRHHTFKCSKCDK